MRPDMNDAASDGRFLATGYRQAGTTEGETPRRVDSPQADQPPRSGPELRMDERLRRLLSQKRGPDAVMVGALSIALLCGLIGFAVNFMWIVAIIVMAVALGFVVADSRRNRIDIVNQRNERGNA
jgi:hypothetical protein